ncbi:MAG: hypothetical protein ACRDYD_03385 [Acidimicrobiales bacterium]
MTRQETTVHVDGALLDAARRAADRAGLTEDDVIEDALRRHLAGRLPSVTEEVWARNFPGALSADEALGLAYEELHAVRAQRRKASSS